MVSHKPVASSTFDTQHEDMIVSFRKEYFRGRTWLNNVCRGGKGEKRMFLPLAAACGALGRVQGGPWVVIQCVFNVKAVEEKTECCTACVGTHVEYL
jgi:hypothetical protein